MNFQLIQLLQIWNTITTQQTQNFQLSQTSDTHAIQYNYNKYIKKKDLLWLLCETMF